MSRLFIALNIPDEIRERINSLRKEAGQKHDKLKWEPKEKLHLTLKFIGEVEDKLADEIAEGLNFLAGYPVIKCELTKFGFFYALGKPRILWIGLKTDEIIFNLVEELNSRLEKFSIPREKKKFNSHITVLRIRGKAGGHFIENFNRFEIPKTEFIADEISLVKSELLPLGSRYTEIKKYNLTERRKNEL